MVDLVLNKSMYKLYILFGLLSVQITETHKIHFWLCILWLLRWLFDRFRNGTMPRAGSNYISLSFEDRINIVQELLLVYNDNKLPRGKLVEVANNFRVHASTISRIWQRALQSRQNITLITLLELSRGNFFVAGPLFTMGTTLQLPLSWFPYKRSTNISWFKCSSQCTSNNSSSNYH